MYYITEYIKLQMGIDNNQSYSVVDSKEVELEVIESSEITVASKNCCCLRVKNWYYNGGRSAIIWLLIWIIIVITIPIWMIPIMIIILIGLIIYTLSDRLELDKCIVDPDSNI